MDVESSIYGEGSIKNFFIFQHDLWLTDSLFRSLKRPIYLFHSMLSAYAILVATLYRNSGKRLHGFRQCCMASQKLYFFRLRPIESLSGCCVKCRAAVSVLVSADFHSKERISLYFFDVKAWYIYTDLNRVTRCCSDNIAWFVWIFSYAILLEASGTILHWTKIA